MSFMSRPIVFKCKSLHKSRANPYPIRYSLLDQAWLALDRLGLAWFGSTWLGLVWIDLAWLGRNDDNKNQSSKNASLMDVKQKIELTVVDVKLLLVIGPRLPAQRGRPCTNVT